MVATWRRAGSIALVLCCLFVFAAPAAAAPGDQISIQDEALRSTSALAADPSRGVYWISEARPSSGKVSAVDATGKTVGSVSFAATPGSVEGLAMYGGRLYIGDIADPGRTRGSVDIFRLESLAYGSTAAFSRWTLRYPDGPQDAKAFMVSPRGNLWIITYGSPGGLYYVPAPARGSGEFTLERVAAAPDWVTDGTFIGATQAVLRTYTGVLAYDMQNYRVTAAEQAPNQPQGESLTSSLDGHGMLLGSQQTDRFLGVRVPITNQQLPAPPATAPGVPSASPTPTPTQPKTPPPAPSSAPAASPTGTRSSNGSSSGGFNSIKTLMALVIAVAMSVGAAVIAFRFQPFKKPSASRSRR